MRLPLTKLENIALIIITTPPLPSLLCLLHVLLVRPGGYTVNLCAFYFYKLIRKLTASLQLQEFSSQLAQSTSGLYHYKRAAFSSQLKSKCGNILAKAAALRITLNVDGDLWCQDHTLTHHTHKLLVY